MTGFKWNVQLGWNGLGDVSYTSELSLGSCRSSTSNTNNNQLKVIQNIIVTSQDVVHLLVFLMCTRLGYIVDYTGRLIIYKHLTWI